MSKILVGVTGWGDHDSLYVSGVRQADKLSTYAGHFPIVEIDSSFYAIQSQKNYEKWCNATPERFGFIVKAFQALTGHDRGNKQIAELTKEQLFDRYSESIQPLRDEGKLKMILFQFPPWFDCNKENVSYIRWCRERYKNDPIAIEFRHQSWFSPEWKERTLDFLKREQLIHVICDEPQIGQGCVPIVPEITHSEHSLIRFHGRNRAGWVYSGEGDWRAVRYNYRYNHVELNEWVLRLQSLKEHTKEISVLFNNNSAGDAVPNAKQLIHMMGVEFDSLAPRQMELF